MSTYQVKINKVLSHIDYHINEKQNLEHLANMALLSKFHFHRIMTSYLGEPLAIYINRVKLEKAAILLKYSDQSIEEIAYSVGYETPTAFTKSFKKAFKVSPKEYKKCNGGSFSIKKVSATPQKKLLLTEEKNISPFKVLSHQIKGEVGCNQTFEGWADLVAFSFQNKIIGPDTKFIGIHWDDPTITAEKNLRYDACVSINTEVKDIDKFSIKEIGGGKYLCVLYKGDYKYLPDVYNQVFRDFIFQRNNKLREMPIFEEYLNNMNDTKKNDLLTVIHIPIE